MNIVKTDIPDVIVFEPKVFGDERGFFLESYNQRNFNEATGEQVCFVQDNHSKSSKGVLRGLHFQWAPFAQGKLVRCVSGAVFDVAVDIRENSPYFGKWVGVELSAENKKQLWIPRGFAHGFVTLTETAEFLYKTTDYYNPEHECSIRWDDCDINIKWPLSKIILSDKDKNAQSLNQIFSNRTKE